jgi:polyphosphate kinase
VPGISETIRVTSIVGRFLEHARIYAFSVGDETRYFIGSADMMGRNLDSRVEVLAPVEDPDACAELGEILATYVADTALAWRLGEDGSWRKLPRGPGIDVHATFMMRATTGDAEAD